MSWSTAFEEFLTDTLVVKGLSSFSTDGYMTPTFGTGTTYKARFVIKQQLVRTLQGTEDLANSVAWVNSTSTFSPQDQYTVNGSTVGPLMAVEQYPDEDGKHHVKLMFGN